MTHRLLRDSISFTFAQTTRDGFFRQETDWGFKISGTDYDATKERWGLVKDVGPDVVHVKVGQYILIEPLKWTTGLDIPGGEIWRTKESFVVATTTEKPENLL